MKTLVGIKILNLLFSEQASLKDKRQAIRDLRQILQTKFGASFAEIDNDDKWQNIKVAVSLVCNNKELIDSAFWQISNVVQSVAEVKVVNEQTDIFSY